LQCLIIHRPILLPISGAVRLQYAGAKWLDFGVAFVSGIAAILNVDGSAVPQYEVERMANVLKPYGPHRQKTLVRGNAAFIFCLDNLMPEDIYERQPLLLANRFVLLFDGRIDNRSELIDALGIEKNELSLVPNSMIALRVFDRWGERGFERILGVFAIIIMDLHDGRLVCARDHMGLRVLHYFHSRERFAVATIPEALFALSWVPRTLNKDKVGDALVQRGLNGETTYYREINRVLPGFIVRVHGLKISKEQYWSPENISDIKLKSDHDYVEAFQEHLEAAVKANLRCHGVPCASITGGLDSSSIAVIAADLLAASGRKLDTFTAVPEAGFTKEETRARYFNETPYVLKIVEANPNIVPHFIRPSEGPMLRQLAEQIRVGGAPLGGMLNGLWGMDILAAARSAGHRVMLSGEMGNHTMSYDGWPLLADLLLRGRWWKLFREITSSGHRWKYMMRHWTIAPCVPAPFFRRYKQWRRGDHPPWHEFSAIHPEFARRSRVVDRAAREYLPFDAPPIRGSKLDRIRLLNSYSETADWFAKVRGNFGIDIRTPAFDRRLVEFCIGIPQDQFLRKGHDRWLIRRAMKGRLPDDVLANTKLGVQSADWFPRLTRERGRITGELKRLAENPDVASIIDVHKLKAILDDWPNKPPEYGPEANALFWALPQALGAAYFIENVTGANYMANSIASTV
jgi:asparagine synthase (glutamine-hydrolysing)